MSGYTFDGMLYRRNRHNPNDGLEEGEIPCFRHPSAFLSLLPEVTIGSLPKDDKTCGICREPYGRGDAPEKVLILPCKHMFGSSCIHHWLSASGKTTCPSCRTVLFGIRAERNPNLDAYGEYLAEPVVRGLLALGTDYDVIHVLHMVDDLIQAFPHLLWANQASWARDGPPVEEVAGFEINRGDFVFASVQLLALFEKISQSQFRIPQQHIDRLGFLVGHLAHELRQPLEEMRVITTWSERGLPIRSLCDPQCQGMIRVALNQMIDTERERIVEIDAEMPDCG